jgi:hypothetical protein
MNRSRILTKVLALSALLATVLAAYLLWARPYQLRWGATDSEVKRSIPGDELHGKPTFLATRAITILGTPDEIWPWLVQMGYGRAGFYGYDTLENLGSDRGIRSADRILPEFQGFTVGDEVPISPVARMVFHAIEPNRFLVWSGEEEELPGVFTWALYPIDENHTRLVSRIRWSYHWNEVSILALEFFTEFTDHIAVRKILQGVKDRVEGRVESMARQNVEFAIYLLLFMIFLFAVVLLLLRPLTRKTWLAGLAAGGAWLITWYAPTPIWIGATLGLLTSFGLRQAWQESVRDA